MAKKSVKIDNLLTLLPKIFGENDVLGVFLRGWLCNLEQGFEFPNFAMKEPKVLLL